MVCYRCPDSGPRGRMSAPEEEYGRRERLLLLHHTGDRYLVPPSPGERYIPPPERYLPPPAPAPVDRYLPPSPVSSDHYNPPPAPAPNERYIPPLSPGSSYPNDRFDRYTTDRYITDRYVPDRYQDRYISPQSPGTNYHTERYVCGSNLDRYIQTSDRFIQPATPTPGGPGDPYMRRDLGYHHHYRLPPPPGFYHPVYQRTLPSAPLRSHHILHHTNRGHIRCCPSLYGTDYPQGNVREGQNGGGSARDYVTSPVLPRGRTSNCPRIGGSSSSSSSGGSSTSSGGGQISPGVVEYVGSSGGRYVSTTPPLPRCGSVSDMKPVVSVGDQCVHSARPRVCDAAHCCAAAAASRRANSQQLTSCASPQQIVTNHHSSVW